MFLQSPPVQKQYNMIQHFEQEQPSLGIFANLEKANFNSISSVKNPSRISCPQQKLVEPFINTLKYNAINNSSMGKSGKLIDQKLAAIDQRLLTD